MMVGRPLDHHRVRPLLEAALAACEGSYDVPADHSGGATNDSGADNDNNDNNDNDNGNGSGDGDTGEGEDSGNGYGSGYGNGYGEDSLKRLALDRLPAVCRARELYETLRALWALCDEGIDTGQ